MNSVTYAQRLIIAEYRGYKAQSLLGAILACQKKFAEAEPLLTLRVRGARPTGHNDPRRRPSVIAAGQRPGLPALNGLWTAGEGRRVAVTAQGHPFVIARTL